MSILHQLLDNEYRKLSENDAPYSHSQILYTIIQIKIENKQLLSNYRQSLYLDIKQFIDAAIASVRHQAFGYDTFALQEVFDLYQHISSKEAIAINKYLFRQLKIQGYEDELDVIKAKDTEISLESFKEGPRPIYLFKCLAYYSCRDLQSVLSSLAITLTVYAIILLPIQRNPQFTLFEVKYDVYSNIFIVNHVLNLLAGAFEIETQFEIIPLNASGVILMIFGKILFILLIAKFLIEEILKKLTE